MNIQNSQFLSLEQIQNQYLNQRASKQSKAVENGQSFQSVLEQASVKTADNTAAVKFSKHAAGRLNDRHIELTDSQLERLNEGTKKAEEKGIHDSLLIMDDLAFIINIPSSTVITAMDQTETKENIFTNIDGAVII